MSLQKSDPTVADMLAAFEPAKPFFTARSRVALDHLRTAFEEGRSLAVLNSGWVSGADDIVRTFLGEIGGGISVAQVTGSCSSDIDGMRELIRSIGFEPNEMIAADIEKIFAKFLNFQRDRHRRTIVVYEETRENRQWVHDQVARFIKLEAANNFGLTVILSRRTRFDELPNEPPLDPAFIQIGKHVSLTPFTLSDTRKFMRWRIDVAESADISRLMDLQAITLVHELCSGVPDAIDQLFCASLILADEEDVAPVTTNVVMRASKVLRLPPMTQQADRKSSLTSPKSKEVPTLTQMKLPRIALAYKGITIRELTMRQQRLSIGRSEENDLCINSRFISRRHATIFRNGAETAVVDLESKNGTFVNSRRIRIQAIADQDEISIGYHSIRFLNPDAPVREPVDGAAHNGSVRLKNADHLQPVNTNSGRQPGAPTPQFRKSATKSD